jgi:hypothetical protein
MLVNKQTEDKILDMTQVDLNFIFNSLVERKDVNQS